MYSFVTCFGTTYSLLQIKTDAFLLNIFLFEIDVQVLIKSFQSKLLKE